MLVHILLSMGKSGKANYVASAKATGRGSRLPRPPRLGFPSPDRPDGRFLRPEHGRCGRLGLAGGFSGLAAHLRTASSCSGSPMQRGRPSRRGRASSASRRPGKAFGSDVAPTFLDSPPTSSLVLDRAQEVPANGTATAQRPSTSRPARTHCSDPASPRAALSWRAAGKRQEHAAKTNRCFPWTDSCFASCPSHRDTRCGCGTF